MEVKLDSDTLPLITSLSEHEQGQGEDCFMVEGEDRVVFVVDEGTLRNAIGKREW